MATVKDPICGKDVDTLRARAVGIYGGVTYYFCSQECKAKYVDPRKAPRPDSLSAVNSAPFVEAPPRPAPPPKLVAAIPAPKPAEKRKDPTPIRPSTKDPTPIRPISPIGKAPTPIGKDPDPLYGREDPSLEGLPAFKQEVIDNEPFEDIPVEKPRKVVHSPSVIAEVRDMKKGSRRWALIIVLLAAAVVAAAVLSLRN
jgi:YHS domain-containing protein